MSHVTVDMGQGTIQMSGLYEDYIWYVNVSRGFFFFFSSHQTLCFMSFWSQRELLIHPACYVRPPQRIFTIQPLWSRSWYLWICCQAWGFMPVPFPLMANLASNDVMQRHNDALHSQHLFAHCPLSKGMWCFFTWISLRQIYFSIHPCGHTVTSSAHSRPDTHLLPPTCLLLLHVIAAVSYIFVKVTACCREREKCAVRKGVSLVRESLLRDLSMSLWMCPSLSCQASVQRYALFLRVLSGCHSAPIFPVPPLVAHRGWKLSNEVRSTLKGSSLPGLWIFVTPPRHPT